MLGTIVNTCTIIIGSIAGAVLKRGVKQEYQTALFNAMGVASLALGANACVQNIPKSQYPVLFIVSISLGSLIGYMLRLDECFNQLVEKLRHKGRTVAHEDAKQEKNRLAEGLSTGILLYCIGPLSMLGPVISALKGDHTFLFTNATLDFVSSMVFASTYGIGMILAAPVLFLWQGMFWLIAHISSSAISNALMAELLIVGGLLITGSGLALLRLKDCKTLNLLPALLIPVIWFLFK